MNLPEFRRFMEEAGGHAAITPDDLVFVDAGQEYLRVTGASREQVIGKALPDVFPDDGRGGLQKLMESFAAVVATAMPDKMEVFRYDVTGHERWWRVDNIPVIHDGKVQYIVIRVEDVTLQIQNTRLIGSQRRATYTLYALITLIVVVLAFAFSNGLGRANHLARQNRAILTRLRADEAHQLENRAANVATWCTAINRTDSKLVAYVEFFRKASPRLPKLALASLPCTALEQKTVQSGAPGGIQ